MDDVNRLALLDADRQTAKNTHPQDRLRDAIVRKKDQKLTSHVGYTDSPNKRTGKDKYTTRPT